MSERSAREKAQKPVCGNGRGQSSNPPARQTASAGNSNPVTLSASSLAYQTIRTGLLHCCSGRAEPYHLASQHWTPPSCQTSPAALSRSACWLLAHPAISTFVHYLKVALMRIFTLCSHVPEYFKQHHSPCAFITYGRSSV